MFDHFSTVLCGNVVGAVDSSMEGLLDKVSNKTKKCTRLKSFTSKVFGIEMEGGGMCTIPRLPWCNDDRGVSIGFGRNNTNRSPVFCDITLWLPVYQNNDNNNEDKDDDYCPFPSLSDCGLNFNDVGRTSDNEDKGVMY